MRLVQVTIPAGKRETVLAVLDDEGIDYVVSDETSGREFTALVSFPLPTPAVEPVLEDLREVGIEENAYTVILDANTVISEQFEELEARYAEDHDESRIAREELTSSARDLSATIPNYVTMTVISSVIATAGLLLNSPAVVVGSMVIAPLVGPALSTSVGTVVDDSDLFRRGLKLQVLGVLLSVASAAAFAALIRTTHLVPPLTDVTTIQQVRERVAPDFLSLVVALGAGIAGALSLSSGVSTALVGVMISVALIPPAATVGIGLAWGQPLVSIGSGVLTMVNILSINFAALAVLWYQGYRPTRWFRLDEARSATLQRIGVLALSIVVLSAFLGGVTVDSYERAATEEQIQEGAERIVTSAGATLVDVEVEQTSAPLFQEPARVIVTVGVDTDQERPDLVDDLDEMADEVSGQNVATEVRYVTISRA
ncbi:TIGR00341 family protein [Halomicrobium salinisoli]|uniref:TIGR00341 family protein n=1 Tax=Halomicrobium salinisoli TaxID=2878391 RepID=UPI001CF07C21|nr:TIGR00341 family protein [Halomicrobium salinisoli]